MTVRVQNRKLNCKPQRIFVTNQSCLGPGETEIHAPTLILGGTSIFFEITDFQRRRWKLSSCDDLFHFCLRFQNQYFICGAQHADAWEGSMERGTFQLHRGRGGVGSSAHQKHTLCWVVVTHCSTRCLGRGWGPSTPGSVFELSRMMAFLSLVLPFAHS